MGSVSVICITFTTVLLFTLVSESTSLPSEIVGNHDSESGYKISKILTDFFESGYDRRVRPNYGGAAVVVNITMFLISISSVSEVKMDFTTDFYFRQYWKDPRLMFEASPGISNLYVGAEVADKIWVPDTFFANEKSAYFHTATTQNTFLRIGSKGEVFRSIRLTVTAACAMQLQFFPMDSQTCNLEIESYGYSMSDIIYRWQSPTAVGLDKKLSLPQFRVMGHTQMEKVINLSTGNYSRLVAQIQFTRSLGFYLIQIYIPASLIVVISWVSFWLHRNATPARVSLGVTTVLTMTTLMSSTNSQLPKISYVKSIDVFLGTCFFLVFASLLEYAAVGYLGKRIAMRKSRAEALAKAQEENYKKMAAAAATIVAQQQPPPLPPPPQLVSMEDTSPPLMSQQLMSAGSSECFHAPNCSFPDSAIDLPPPIPPAPTSVAVSPIRCSYASTRPQAPKGRVPNYYQSNMGYRTAIPYYDRSPGNKKPCPCQGPTSTPQHAVPESMSLSTQSNQQQHQQSSAQQRKISGVSSAPRKSIVKETAGGAGGKDLRSVAIGGAMIRPIPDKGFFKKSKSNPNKVLGISPSDVDKYSRVIFPVCFVCFNLMYWIIYMHIRYFPPL